MLVESDKQKRECVTLEDLRERVGGAPSTSDWLSIDQALIDGFAQLTGDLDVFRADPEHASVSASAVFAAQHFLILSLTTQLMKSALKPVRGMRLGANYGFDRVRFITPVPVHSRIRVQAALVDICESKPEFHRFSYDITVEIEHADRPALFARWIVVRWRVGD